MDIAPSAFASTEVVDLHRSLRTRPVFAWDTAADLGRLKNRRRNAALVSGRADALPVLLRQQQQAQLVSGLRLPDEPWLCAEPRADAEVILRPEPPGPRSAGHWHRFTRCARLERSAACDRRTAEVMTGSKTLISAA